MTILQKDRFRDHPILGFVDWVLRGIGQVVFQNNPISGAMILGGNFLQFLDLWSGVPLRHTHQYIDGPAAESR